MQIWLVCFGSVTMRKGSLCRIMPYAPTANNPTNALRGIGLDKLILPGSSQGFRFPDRRAQRCQEVGTSHWELTKALCQGAIASNTPLQDFWVREACKRVQLPHAISLTQCLETFRQCKLGSAGQTSHQSRPSPSQASANSHAPAAPAVDGTDEYN